MQCYAHEQIRLATKPTNSWRISPVPLSPNEALLSVPVICWLLLEGVRFAHSEIKNVKWTHEFLHCGWFLWWEGCGSFLVHTVSSNMLDTHTHTRAHFFWTKFVFQANQKPKRDILNCQRWKCLIKQSATHFLTRRVIISKHVRYPSVLMSHRASRFLNFQKQDCT